MNRKTFLTVAVLILTVSVSGYGGLSDDGDLIGTADEVLEDEDTEYERYIVNIDEDEYSSETLDSLNVDVEYEYEIISQITVEVPEDAVSELEDVQFVEDLQRDRETSLPVTGAEESDGRPQSFETGEEQVIAVLDTGVDDGHVDLDGEVIDHRDFTGSGIQDARGHGTHVAGIAAGTGEGDSRFAGVSPESSVMNVKVLGDDGSGKMSYAIRGIEYAVENEADVIVMSLGTEVRCDGTDPLSRAADNAIEQGVPLVASAGNSGPESETITSPGCGRDVLTVGASGGNSIASFSSRGFTQDGRMKPDLVAPGVNIGAPEAGTRSSYVGKSGTSMSAPYVAGGIAVMTAENDDTEPEDYFDALRETSYSLEEDQRAQGHGRINLTAAREHLQGENFTSARSPRERPTVPQQERTPTFTISSLLQSIITFFTSFLG